MARHVGILLRKNSQRLSQVFLLDKNMGKIQTICDRLDLSRGSLMAYNVITYGSSMKLNHIDLLDLPIIQNVHDLMFFHQVLELSYYFIPLGKVVTDIFELLLYLYVYLQKLSNDVSKKIFLCKFFAHLGFYPEEDQCHRHVFQLVRVQCIDVLLDKPIDLYLERKLDQWLDYCISLHPCINNFKTVSLFMSRKS